MVYDVRVPEPTAARLSAEQGVTALFERHYAGLVRLATLVLRSNEAADEVVQDAFVALYGKWDSLRDDDRAMAYLRRSVVNGCQSRHRHLAVVDRHTPRSVRDEPSAEAEAIRNAVGDRVLDAVGGLPTQQRTVVEVERAQRLPAQAGRGERPVRVDRGVGDEQGRVPAGRSEHQPVLVLRHSHAQ